MPQEWFVRRGEIERGPLSSQELKRLVEKGTIVATDMIRKSDQPDWREAGSVRGLFPKEGGARPVPPPLPSSSVDQPPPSGTSPKPSMASETLKTGLADLVSTAKQAKDLASAHARKTQVTQMILPKAFWVLGKHLFESGSFHDEFSELFQRITATHEEIASIATTNSQRPPATDMKGKLQSGAAQVMAQGQTAKLNLRVDSLLKQLGKQAFELHGTSAGPSELVEPILSAHEEISRLDAQIGQLSSSENPSFWRRLRMAGLAFVSCSLVVVSVIYWMSSKTTPNRGASVGTPIRPSHSFESEMSGIQQQLKEITQQAEASAADAKKREKLLEAKRELEFAQAKLEREKSARERQERQADEMAKRQQESSIQEVQEQGDRKKLAERLFGGISFDPSQCVTLSDSLKKSGATVELRGKDFTMLQRLHKEKDWLALINYLVSGDGVAYDKYPTATVIERAFRRLNELDLFVLVQTKQVFGGDQQTTLSTIQFPLSVDRKFHYGDVINRYFDFTRHPDGVGYLRRWKVADGVAIVYSTKQRHETEDFVYSTTRKFNEFRDGLNRKVELGELDEETRRIRVTSELVRLYEVAWKWAQGQ